MAYSLDDARGWLALYERGMTHEEIALEIGASAQTIGTWLRRLPEYAPRAPGGRAGVPNQHTNRRTGTLGARPPKKTTLYPSGRGHRRRGRY